MNQSETPYILFDSLSEPYSLFVKRPRPASKVSKNFLKIAILVAFILLCGALLLLIGYYPQKQTIKDQGSHAAIAGTEFVTGSDLDSHDPGSAQTERVVLSDIDRLEAKDITPEKFLRLRELVINSPNLVHLQLDSNLKLDILVVNNSKLTSFSYNSTELKTLILIDNYNMTEFVNSNIPLLSNLTITRTGINKWQNVNFGNLSYFGVFGSYFSQFPLFNATSVQYFQVVNSQTPGRLNFDYFQVMPIQRIKLQNSKIDYFIVDKAKSLREIKLLNVYITAIELNDLTPLTSIQVVSPSLSQVKLKSLPNLSVASIQAPITKLELDSLNLTSLDAFTLDTIDDLSLKSVPIKQLSGLKLPSVTSLSIDFSLFQDSTLNISCPSLISIVLSNYKSEEPFVWDNFPKLGALSISESSLSKLDISKTNLKYIRLFDIESSEEFQLTLNSIIQSISLISMDIRTFSNLTLESLLSLKIQFSNIEQISNNIFPNVSDIDISYNFQLQHIRNNSFTNAETVVLYDNYQLILNQSLPKVIKLDLENNNPSILDSLTSDNFPNLQTLILKSDNLESIQYLDLPSLQSFQLESTGLVSIENNTLQSLIKWNVKSDVVNIRGNHISNIRTLSLRDAPNLNFEVLLEQFKDIEEEGASPQTIEMPISTPEEVIEEVKNIFPNAAVR